MAFILGAELLKLGDVAAVRAGFPFRGAVETNERGSVYAVQPKDLRPDARIDWSRVARTNLGGRRRATDWLAAGDILFTCKGPRFHAGCIDDPPDRAVCAPHFFHLRVHDGARVLPLFLAWLINQGPVQRQLQQAAEGSSQLTIRRPMLEAIELRVPSLSNQHRIVTLAQLARQEKTALEQLIHNRERELDHLAEELCAQS